VNVVQTAAITPETPLDAGIERAVQLLVSAGIATYESCEGGEGHSFPEPTVRFRGNHAEALRAVATILDHDLPIDALRKVWWVTRGELEGPWWEVTFCTTARERGV
jgi:hypothetical protein